MHLGWNVRPKDSSITIIHRSASTRSSSRSCASAANPSRATSSSSICASTMSPSEVSPLPKSRDFWDPFVDFLLLVALLLFGLPSWFLSAWLADLEGLMGCAMGRIGITGMLGSEVTSKRAFAMRETCILGARHRGGAVKAWVIARLSSPVLNWHKGHTQGPLLLFSAYRHHSRVRSSPLS